MLAAAKSDPGVLFPLAAFEGVGENSRQGIATKNPTLHRGSSELNSTTALGMQPVLRWEGVRSRYTGKERDSESNLDNFGARYNSSQLGRFMSPDPSGLGAEDPEYPQSWNLYSYVRNNPLTFTDPDGLDCVYLNDAGNGIESVDQNSNAGECQENGGAWAPGTITNVTFDPNSNDVLLGYANMGNNGNVDYSQITATPGQFNPGDEIYGLANDINQMNLTSNIFKIYGASAAIGATGGAACYYFCPEAGVTTLGLEGAGETGTAEQQVAQLTEHAAGRLAERGISPTQAQEAIKTAEETGNVTTQTGKYGTTQTVYKGTNGVTVVVENAGRNAGKIITAWLH